MHIPRPVVVAFAAPTFRVTLSHRVPPRIARRLQNGVRGLQQVPRGIVVRQITLGGRPCERTTVGATERPRAVLYLHGGGYTVGSPRTYRAAAAHLARTTGAVVFNLDYRMAPEHPFPAAWEDAVAAFRELVSVHGFEPSRIAIAGDSAGGGLAVATARTLTDEGLRPAALALFSPWTDPSDEDFERDRDFVASRAWGHATAEMYLAGADPKDPRYAPMHGSLVGLPPTLIEYAADEMLRPQIERFAALAAGAGVDLESMRIPNHWHSAVVLSGTLRSATEATETAGAWLRAHLDPDLDPAPPR